MRILLIGGAGDMARSLVDLMRNEEAIEGITLADREEQGAMARAQDAGPKFSAEKVDLGEPEALSASMRGHDLVINYAGPFYRWERPAAEAAVAAGVDYLSIADDYDAYLAVADLEDCAREAGVKVMTGFGNSPGLTQLLAKIGCETMEKPAKVAVNWAGGANEAVGPSNILHVLHLMSGETLQWRDGAEQYVPCGRGKKVVEFPEPIGRIPTWYTGHAESVTLPRSIPGLDYVSVHGGAVPAFDFQFVALLGRLGLTSTHERRMRLLRLFTPLLPLFQSKSAPDKSAGRVEVWGTDAGAERYVHYTYVGHIAFITSCPCLQTALWWQKGSFDHLPGGVYPPERLIEAPRAFVEELCGRGVTINLHE